MVGVGVAQKVRVVLHAHHLQLHQALHQQRRQLRLTPRPVAHVHVPEHLAEHLLDHHQLAVHHHQTEDRCVARQVLAHLAEGRRAQAEAQDNRQLDAERAAALVPVGQNRLDFRQRVLVGFEDVLDEFRVVLHYSLRGEKKTTLVAHRHGGCEVPDLAVLQHHLRKRALHEGAAAERGECDDELGDDHAVGRGRRELRHVLPTVEAAQHAYHLAHGQKKSVLEM